MYTKALVAVLFLLTSAGFAQAQAAHSNTLIWVASTSTGVTYNVYRSAGSCAGPFTKLNTAPVTGLTYTDSGLADGAVSCYYVTAVLVTAGIAAESTQSNFALATTPTTSSAPPIVPPPGALKSSAT